MPNTENGAGFGSLDELAARADAPVLVVHCRDDVDDDWHASHIDAARKAYPTYVVIGLRGNQATPEPLLARDVVFWPWMGSPTAAIALQRFARNVARTAKRTRMLGGNLGPADLNGHNPITWARDHVSAVEPADDHEVVDLYEEWFGQHEEPEERPPLVSDYTPDHPDMIEDIPEPINVFEKPMIPRLEKRMLPAAIADYVFDQSEIIGSDPCILAIASLVATASLIHDDIRLQPKEHEYSWVESARLWGVIVGDPSTKKTPPIAKAVAHVKKIDIDLAQSSAAEAEAYRIELKVHTAIEKRHIDEASKGGYKQGRSDLHPAPVRPPERRALVEDITIEKCAEVMADNPGGILALHDELSGWFGAMDAYRAQGNKDQPFWLRAYNGGSMRVDRKTAGSSILVSNVSACLIGGIQPDLIRSQANKMGHDGLLQRFMIVCAGAADPIGVDRQPDREGIENYRIVQDRLSKQKGDPSRPLILSAGARTIFNQAMRRAAAIESEPEASPRLRAHAGKLSGLFVRLCLTYHAMDCAYAGSAIAPIVHEQTAKSVESFIFDFLVGHIRHFYDDVLGDSEAIEHVRWIAGHILARRPETITNTTIFKAYRSWRGVDDRMRRLVMQYLDSAGWLFAVEPSNRGQPVRTWKVNQRVHELFEERAFIELERIDKAMDSINMNKT